MSKVRTVRLSDEASEAIDNIARICERDANFILKEAVNEYLAHNQWVIEETERRLQEVKEGKAKLIPHDEVVREFKERTKHLRNH